MSKKINAAKLVQKIEQLARAKMAEQNLVSMNDLRNLKNQLKNQEKYQKESKTVLIVEDDETVRSGIEKLLRELGCRVLSAASGLELSNVLTESVVLELIILDIGLPWLNGYELAKIMKEHEDLKNIPLIFVSAQVTEENIKKGFDVGAADYIKKPFDSAELSRSVTTLLGL